MECAHRGYSGSHNIPYKMKKIISSIIALAFLCGCTDEIPMVNLGIDDVYYIPRMQKLDLHPALTGERYEWYVDGKLVSENKDYIFLAGKEGILKWN